MSKTINKRTNAGKKGGVVRKPAKRAAMQRGTKQAPTSTKATKKETIIALLRREDGAILNELMAATGWQAHSVRGFISGTLRKKLGLTVEHVKRNNGMTAYRIAE